MRILYQNGKLLVSLSDDEVDKFYKYKHTPVEIPIGFLKVLHEDITHAMQKAWREKVEEDYGKK
jgi:hypothetical protein|tara:strand:- start:185 stop:376 length:192 start_codon:yes stop_codon:yes gene_type:complete